MSSSHSEQLPSVVGTCPAPTRILVVEDDRDSAELLREILECEGFQVSVAADQWTAEHAAESLQPGSILLDIHLSSMEGDGIELCRRLQAHGDRHWRIFALTGDLKLDSNTLASCGFDGVLYKPLDVRTLLVRLSAPRSSS